MTDAGFAQGWAVLQAAMGLQELPDSTRALYRNALAEMDDVDFRGSVRTIVEDTGWRNDRLPTIADIKAAVPMRGEPRATPQRTHEGLWADESTRLVYEDVVHRNPRRGDEVPWDYLGRISRLASEEIQRMEGVL